MKWNKDKTDANEVIQDAETNLELKTEALPAFFLNRAIGWFAVAVVVLGLTLFWVKTGGIFADGLFWGAALVAVASIFNGIRTWRIGSKGNYFTIRLKCMDIRPLNILENLPSFINPTSNTAFKSGQQVTFETVSGTKVFFTYERSRKFLVGARYDFYFNKPNDDEKVTVDMLERLRIDHAIVRDELSGEDITADITRGKESRMNLDD